MVTARAWYVKGRKRAFPYGERLVAGPLDTMADAFAETRRLREAGLYPDAELFPHEHAGKSLPTVTPRTRPPGDEPAYDLRKRPERERLAADLAARAEAFGASVLVENWDGEPDVNFSTPSLRGNVWCVSVQGELPIISWYGAAWPIRPVPGAWGDEGGHKASSLPGSWPELFDMLETGLCAAIDGSAFALD